MTRVSQLDNQVSDTPQDNPLTAEAFNDTITPSTPLAPKLKELLKEPKFKLLFILSIVLVTLLLLALVATIVRKKPTTSIYKPTPTVIVTPMPTVNQSQLSPQWQQNLQGRQSETQINEDFLPPAIDTEIGQ